MTILIYYMTILIQYMTILNLDHVLLKKESLIMEGEDKKKTINVELCPNLFIAIMAYNALCPDCGFDYLKSKVKCRKCRKNV